MSEEDLNEAEPLIEIGSFEIPNPGGDPDAVRRAATGWATMAGDIRNLKRDLASRAGQLSDADWSDDSRDAFDAWLSELGGELDSVANGFDEMSGTLNDVAEPLDETKNFVRDILIELGVTIGVGIVVGLFSFGLGTAAAAARTARLVQQVLQKVAWLRGIYAALQAARAAMLAFKANYMAGRILLAFGRTATTGAATHTGSQMILTQNLNPMAVWDGESLRNLVITSGIGAPLSSLRHVSRFSNVANRHPAATNALESMATFTLGTATIDTLDGRLGTNTLVTLGFGVPLTGGSGALVGQLRRPRPGQDIYLPEPAQFPAPGIRVPTSPRVGQAIDSLTPGGTTSTSPRGLTVVHAPGIQRVELWRPDGIATPSTPPGHITHTPQYDPPALEQIVASGMGPTTAGVVAVPNKHDEQQSTPLPEFDFPQGGLAPAPPPPVPVAAGF